MNRSRSVISFLSMLTLAIVGCDDGSTGTTCEPGFADCNGVADDGCEVSLDSTTNCGACGVVCSFANAAPLCTEGACALGACDADFEDCNQSADDGCEANLATESENCGACGAACPMGEVCSIGECNSDCAPGLTDCGGGSCLDTTGDPFNCGTCGTVCPPGENEAGLCIDATCAPPFVTSTVSVSIPDSDGCQLLLDTNADQIDVLDDGTVVVVLRCAAELMLSLSRDAGATFGSPVAISATLPDAAVIRARSATEFVALLGRTPNVEFIRTTDAGESWSEPVIVDTNFADVGPGPSLAIIEDGTSLVATWSGPGSTTPVSRSGDDGSTWNPLPDVTLSGPNYCPDLVVEDATGDLLLLNEVARETFRLAPDEMSWELVGSLGPETTFTDFAGGGPLVYGTGSSDAVSRAPLSAAAMFTPVTLEVGGTSNLRTMDVDSFGNLSLALQLSALSLRLNRWPSTADVLDEPVDITTESGAVPALATTPSRNATVLAYSTGSGPVLVHVQAY